MDVLNESDCRITVVAEHMKNTGFDLSIATWQDSSVFGCEVSWIAFHKSFTDIPNDIQVQNGTFPH